MSRIIHLRKFNLALGALLLATAAIGQAPEIVVWKSEQIPEFDDVMIYGKDTYGFVQYDDFIESNGAYYLECNVNSKKSWRTYPKDSIQIKYPRYQSPFVIDRINKGNYWDMSGNKYYVQSGQNDKGELSYFLCRKNPASEVVEKVLVPEEEIGDIREVGVVGYSDIDNTFYLQIPDRAVYVFDVRTLEIKGQFSIKDQWLFAGNKGAVYGLAKPKPMKTYLELTNYMLTKPKTARVMITGIPSVYGGNVDGWNPYSSPTWVSSQELFLIDPENSSHNPDYILDAKTNQIIYRPVPKHVQAVTRENGKLVYYDISANHSAVIKVWIEDGKVDTVYNSPGSRIIFVRKSNYSNTVHISERGMSKEKSLEIAQKRQEIADRLAAQSEKDKVAEQEKKLAVAKQLRIDKCKIKSCEEYGVWRNALIKKYGLENHQSEISACFSENENTRCKSIIAQDISHLSSVRRDIDEMISYTNLVRDKDVDCQGQFVLPEERLTLDSMRNELSNEIAKNEFVLAHIELKEFAGRYAKTADNMTSCISSATSTLSCNTAIKNYKLELEYADIRLDQISKNLQKIKTYLSADFNVDEYKKSLEPIHQIVNDISWVDYLLKKNEIFALKDDHEDYNKQVSKCYEVKRTFPDHDCQEELINARQDLYYMNNMLDALEVFLRNRKSSLLRKLTESMIAKEFEFIKVAHEELQREIEFLNGEIK